jgi:hypothetical protein
VDKSSFALVLGSAVIGALTSAIILAISNWRDRRTRQREMLLTLAVQMTNSVIDSHLKTIELSGESRSLFPHVVMARWHHKQLKLLFRHEKLSDHLEKQFSDFINKPHGEIR